MRPAVKRKLRVKTQYHFSIMQRNSRDSSLMELTNKGISGKKKKELQKQQHHTD